MALQQLQGMEINQQGVAHGAGKGGERLDGFPAQALAGGETVVSKLGRGVDNRGLGLDRLGGPVIGGLPQGAQVKFAVGHFLHHHVMTAAASHGPKNLLGAFTALLGKEVAGHQMT